MNDKLFKIFVINYYGNLPKILEELEITPQRGGLMFCPMHDNYNTPAAKLFKDRTGWHFFCFNEGKQFGTYDVYKDVYHLNMNTVFDSLWSNLSETAKSQMQDLFGELDENAPVKDLELYQAFKYKQINYSQLKKELCNRIAQE